MVPCEITCSVAFYSRAAVTLPCSATDLKPITVEGDQDLICNKTMTVSRR